MGIARVPEAPAAGGTGWLWALVIALLFAGWGLHTVGYNNIVDTDGARHAMNGAFIHDWIVRGHYSDLLYPSGILHFAKRYYCHLPALSMPYHPPLFPAVEAVFFFLFGVNVFAARLAIAIAVALSAVGLFRLVVATWGSIAVAAFSTITFLSLPYVLWLGSDVMLEFPALVCVVLAIRCLANVDEKYSLKSALLFAVLAGAAVWTKQQTVFLGAVPFFYIALIGRWRLFLKPAIWISSAVFLAMVGALSMLSLPVHGAGVNQVMQSTHGHGSVFMRNLVFYIRSYPGTAGPSGMVLLAAFAAALAGGLIRRRSAALYASWAISCLLVLLILGPFSARYLFFALPPMIVLGYASLHAIAIRWPAARLWGAGASTIVLLLALAFGSTASVAFMRGPDEAARQLASAAPHRILYCGGTDGNFIFSYRAHRSPMDTIILAGDKLPATVFTPAGLEEFARRYGVEYIVLEHAPGLRPRFKHPWEPLFETPPPSAVPWMDVPLASSDSRWNGLLRIYRFTNPAPATDDELTMRMNMIGGSMSFAIGR
jgi:4-amino-4-deoxy-L-arabinose transferase-like glycosyltransferase